MTDYTPKADKAEWHLTYRCTLKCPACNRACFLPATTPDMTLDDAREFIRQADELNWHPKVMIIGGEPTLHKEFQAFVELAAQWATPRRVEVWSNGYGPHAQRQLDWVRKVRLALVQDGTIKTGDVQHHVNDIFVSPADFGKTREPCGTHSCFTDKYDCGISVDSVGYSDCCMGGAIDGLLGLNARTKRLADLFDPAFAEQQTRKLCEHCGQNMWPRMPAQTWECRKTRMSKSWRTAALRILGQ